MNEQETKTWMNDTIRQVPLWRRYANLWRTRVQRHWRAIAAVSCTVAVILSPDPWRMAASLTLLVTGLLAWSVTEAMLGVESLRRELRLRAETYERRLDARVSSLEARDKPRGGDAGV